MAKPAENEPATNDKKDGGLVLICEVYHIFLLCQSTSRSHFIHPLSPNEN